MQSIPLNTPDGKTINLNVPDGATPDQIHMAAQQAAQHYAQTAAPQQQSLTGKVWDALAVPEQKSREGLNMIANAIPETVGGPMTGNTALDVLKGTPKVLAETAAETAPQFVSRGAILTAGAARAAQEVAPLAKVALRGLGGQAEQISGAAPGSLEAAYKDATLITSKGKKAVQGTYEAAKDIGGQVGPELLNAGSKKEFVDTAVDLANKNNLLPTEALEARKELDSIKKTLPRVVYESKREILDKVAKVAFGGADAEYKRAVMSDSLRKLVPQNMHGGASAFKMGIMTALRNMGTVGKIISTGLSPAAQGVAATSAGLVGRYGVSPLVNNPVSASAVTAALQELSSYRRKKK